MGLSGRHITVKRIFGASVKNLCDDVFSLHIQTFRVKFRKITICGSTCWFEPFFSLLKQFIFLEPYLSGTFLGLPGRNITFNSILEPNVKNLWDDVFLLHIQTFRVKFRKITTCGSTCRFEPFFSLLKTIHIFRTMAFRTCLGLSGCNITFK